MSSDLENSYLRKGSKYKGLLGYLTSTDHKRIGLMYLYSVIFFFFAAGSLGGLMRMELMRPGQDILTAQGYNGVFTVHGIIMIFLVVIPGLSPTFGNIIMPLQIGARDVAFPRLNLFSFYLYIIGAILALLSQFTGGGIPDAGWTFYAPYSTSTHTNIVMAVTAATILGFSSILTGLNFIVTIHRLRAPGMTWFKMPLFTWSLYATAWVQVLATPIIGITLLMIIAERVLHVGFFDPTLGGDPTLYIHLFWIYSHPAVYIMILPAMGAVTEIIPVFCRRRIFGYKFVAFSSLAIAGVGYLVWGHHMYTVGMSYEAAWIFSLLTFIVAVPSAIKMFNWIATMYKGSIKLDPPFVFVLFFMSNFMIGGLTGLVQGALATDIHVHDTAFVVAHFHYIIFGGMGFGFLASIHYWFPKIWGRMYNMKLANIYAIILFIGFNLLYFPQFVLGMEGLPRRYFDYLPQFRPGQVVSGIGAIILAVGFFMMLYNLIKAAGRGKQASANPWEGKTLEWQIPSPPPVENFETIPVVTEHPYNY
jgi:cytochrome c oxidase subunit I